MRSKSKNIFHQSLLTGLLVIGYLPVYAQTSGAEDGAPRMGGPWGLIKRVWKAPRVTQNPYGDGSNWTIQADKTETLKDQNKYIGRGHVSVYIDGQEASLTCDEATFDQNSNILEVKGSVRIERKGMATNGNKYRFKISSPDYLVTRPGAEPKTLNLFAREKTKHRKPSD